MRPPSCLDSTPVVRGPGFLPILHLDHIYYDGPLELLALDVHRTRKPLVASDHLPLIADFKYLKGIEPALEPPGTEVVREA